MNRTYTPSMTDILDQWRTVTAGFTARLEAVSADQWAAQTPCSEFTVKQLVDHVAGAQRMIPKALGAEGDIDTEIGDDPVADFKKLSAAAEAALSEPGALEKVVPSPMGEAPAAQGLALPVMDLLVHTWDLARATGGDETLPADIVATAHEMLKPMDAMLRNGVFAAKVEVGDDASPQDQFIAFTGRQP